MRDAFTQSAISYRKLFIGREVEVLWEKTIEKKGIWNVSGLSDNYLRVEALSTKNLYNQVTQAKIVKLNGLGLLQDLNK